MSKFVVNTDSLEALQQGVEGLALELEYGGAPIGRYVSHSSPEAATRYGVSGGQLNGADQAIDQFLTAWRNSLGEIGDNMENVSRRWEPRPRTTTRSTTGWACREG